MSLAPCPSPSDRRRAPPSRRRSPAGGFGSNRVPTRRPDGLLRRVGRQLTGPGPRADGGTAISLDVAAVPESLPAVVSLRPGRAPGWRPRTQSCVGCRPSRRRARCRSSRPTRRVPSPRVGCGSSACGRRPVRRGGRRRHARRSARRVDPCTDPDSDVLLRGAALCCDATVRAADDEHPESLPRQRKDRSRERPPRCSARCSGCCRHSTSSAGSCAPSTSCRFRQQRAGAGGPVAADGLRRGPGRPAERHPPRTSPCPSRCWRTPASWCARSAPIGTRCRTSTSSAWSCRPS